MEMPPLGCWTRGKTALVQGHILELEYLYLAAGKSMDHVHQNHLGILLKC